MSFELPWVAGELVPDGELDKIIGAVDTLWFIVVEANRTRHALPYKVTQLHLQNRILLNMKALLQVTCLLEGIDLMAEPFNWDTLGRVEVFSSRNGEQSIAIKQSSLLDAISQSNVPMY